MLATALKATRYGGVVTCCGMAASPELVTTVYPFILRGVSLLGVDAAGCPMARRLAMWEKLASGWKLDGLDWQVRVCGLEELSGQIDTMLAGQGMGRVVVDLG